jgi:hypothetical protein
MALDAMDINGSPFSAGDEVLVRCRVTSITSASGATSGFGGSGDSVLLAVDVAGNAGEKTGVTLTVSPIQCRRSAGKSATGVTPS